MCVPSTSELLHDSCLPAPRQLAPSPLIHAPVEVFVQRTSLVRRAEKIVGRRAPEALRVQWKPRDDRRLRGKTLERPPLEHTFVLSQEERLRLRARSRQERTDAHAIGSAVIRRE